MEPAILIIGWLGFAGAVAAASAKGVKRFLLRRANRSSDKPAYDNLKNVDNHIQFHFGKDQDVFPYAAGPKDALHFPARCAHLCERYCSALQDFTGETGDTLALDLGCAVGGATFEMSKCFTHVLGIDSSPELVEAAQEMAVQGSRQYTAVLEGDITQQYTASLDEDVDCARVRFEQGDACNLRSTLPAFDAVLVARLLTELTEPTRLLQRLPSLVRARGVVVLVSPYSWRTGKTPRDRWLGGYVGKDGEPVSTAEAIAAVMSKHFDFVAQHDVPYLVREHVRKYEWGCSHAVVWRRKDSKEPGSIGMRGVRDGAR